MRHEVICTWLGVAADHWPPDHYLLLGIIPGESDPDRIEQAVEQRLACVRQYQLTNPEQATEAMNCIAQAFVCLTDVSAKEAYDTKLFGGSFSPSRSNDVEPAISNSRGRLQHEADAGAEAMAVTSEPVVWLNQALQAMKRTTTTLEVPLVEAAEAPGADEGDLQQTSVAVEEEQDKDERERPTVSDPTVEGARAAPAQRGLATKRAFYYRLARTRALLYVWKELGEYLNDPKRRLERPAEARTLMRALKLLRQELANFPPLLGKAGQPGYLVVSLARQQVVVPTYQTLLPSQRQALSRDWEAGHRLLIAHKEFIREELRSLRRKSRLSRLVRTGRTYLNDHPLGLLVAMGLVAIAVALWRTILAG